MQERYDVPAVLLFGGVGGERRISELGAYSFIEKAKACEAPLLPMGIDPSGDWYIYVGDVSHIKDGTWSTDADNLIGAYPYRKSGEGGFLTDFGFISVGCVIPLLHGEGGEDGAVQGALLTAGIKFAGCSHATGAVAYDKAYTKIIAESLGIPTVPWVLFISDGKRCDTDGACRTVYTPKRALELAAKSFGFPMFIKPARAGSSLGASLVTRDEEFFSAVELAQDYSSKVLVEKALTEKIELECAYFSSDAREIISSPASISAGSAFYDFDTKYKTGAESVTLVCGSARTAELVKKYTARLAGALGVEGISRFDYFLLPDGSVYFNEINTFPGFTERSLYLPMLEGEGVDFETVLGGLIGSQNL